MSFSAGDAFFFNVDSSHLWFIISDPELHPQELLCVNLTTLRNSVYTNSDMSCVVTAAEYHAVTHDSFAFYEKAIVLSLQEWNTLTTGNHIKLSIPASADLLQKLRDGAKTSPHFKGKFKHLL